MYGGERVAVVGRDVIGGGGGISAFETRRLVERKIANQTVVGVYHERIALRVVLTTNRTGFELACQFRHECRTTGLCNLACLVQYLV